MNEDDDAQLGDVEVEPAEEDIEVELEPSKDAKTGEEEARLGHEEGGEDDAVVTDPANPERPKKSSKQRRDERKAVERRVRDERDFLLQQNAEILNRLAAVEGTALNSHLVTVDSRLSECLNDVEQAERLEIAAREGKDVEAELQARKIRQKAADRASLFQTEKERLSSLMAQRKTAPQVPVPVPGAQEINQHAAQFRADKPWLQFGQNGAPINAETAVAVSIDHALSKEGRFGARDKSYWDELDKRVKAALPQLSSGYHQEGDDLEDEDDPVVQQQQTTQKPKTATAKVAAVASGKKGPAVGSSARQGTSQGPPMRLSAERVSALKELGVWGTPEQKEWVEEYAKYDRAQAAKN